jgi:hypothetical protein
MHRLRLLIALLAAAIAAPASADYYQFTGTFSFAKSSEGFLPTGVSVSGSGVASFNPNAIDLVQVAGFTGTLQTSFGSTAGYSQKAFITRIGDGSFSKPTSSGKLRGRLGVGGLGRYSGPGSNTFSFPLTANEMTGLGPTGRCPVRGGEARRPCGSRPGRRETRSRRA